MARLKCDPLEVQRALDVLLDPGQVVEIRVLESLREGRGGLKDTLSGFFDKKHHGDLVEAMGAVGEAAGFYWTLNPVHPGLLARSHNRLKRAGKGSATGDREVQCRRWLPVDLDPCRPAGISATEEEKAHAFSLADRIEADLTSEGWPAPVRIDSGNGTHLLFRVDLPGADGGLVERCLKALDSRYSSEVVKVDTSNFNPSRIFKLPGTPACKGDDTPDRPHRMSRLLKVPNPLVPVPLELLEFLAAQVVEGAGGKILEQTSPEGRFDVETWLQRHGLAFQTAKPYQGGQIWVLEDCPWRPGDGETAFVIQRENGAISAGCHHDTCPGARKQGNHWCELRDRFDQRSLGAQGSRLEGRVEASGPSLEVIDPGTFALSDPAPIRWLLEGLLPWGVPAILAAKTNAGKSMLALEISMVVAAGLGMFGLGGAGIPLNVLYVGMEDDRSEFHRRFHRCRELLRAMKDWGEAEEAALLANWRAVIPDWSSPGVKTLSGLREDLLEHARSLCMNGRQLGLMVLDTFAALSEGEENQAEVQQAFWANCHTLASKTGCTPLVIHHVRKMGNSVGRGPAMPERLSFDNLRGSSAIVAGARAILQVEPLTAAEAERLQLDVERATSGNYVLLALTKLTGAPKGAWMALEQRQAGEQGAGFFVPMAGSADVCAALQGRKAVARKTLAEEVLLSLAGGCEDREELARRHWPLETPGIGAKRVKSTLQDLRRKYGWLQKECMALTEAGFRKAQALGREENPTRTSQNLEGEEPGQGAAEGGASYHCSYPTEMSEEAGGPRP